MAGEQGKEYRTMTVAVMHQKENRPCNNTETYNCLLVFEKMAMHAVSYFTGMNANETPAYQSSH